MVIPRCWFPDETLYSLCGRHHRLSANTRPVETYRELFGEPCGKRPEGFGERLASFAQKARGELGTPIDIVLSHTVFPFYLWLVPGPVANAILDSFQDVPTRWSCESLILGTGGFGRKHPLRACGSCMRQDVEEFGVAYWHLAHQFPGVTLCLRHGVLLDRVRSDVVVGSGSSWLLPRLEVLEAPQNNNDVDVEAGAVASHIACAIGTFGSRARLNPMVTRATYLLAYHRRGLLKANSMQLCRLEVARQFAPFCSSLGGYADYSDLLHVGAVRLAINSVSLYRRQTNPIWHVPTIAWAFGSWRTFTNAYFAMRLAKRLPAPLQTLVGAGASACSPLRRGGLS